MTDKQIIDALRCISEVPASQHDCSTCAYRIVEEWEGHEIESCDGDRICKDAAKRLEELTSQRTHTISPADASAAQYADNPVLAQA